MTNRRRPGGRPQDGRAADRRRPGGRPQTAAQQPADDQDDAETGRSERPERPGDRLASVTEPSRSLTLTASLRPAALDARRGVVRLHPEVFTALNLRPGDPVTLRGRRQTAGIAAFAEPGASRALLYADDLILGNLGSRDGGQITISPAPIKAARTVTLAGPTEIQALVSPEMLRLALLGKVVTVDDNVSLLPQDVAPDNSVRGLLEAARRSLSNTIGYGFTSALLTVTGAEPKPNLDDLPGLRQQAHELSELLDLGFHHTEVLSKLGTTVQLGVLITGPAGSGKSALVKAVAATVEATVTPLWAPEIAALTNNDAAARLRSAAANLKAPGVLLIADVEALAPRDEPGPLATVFRQVIRGVLVTGAAVVCTTSRPEEVDPALRSPGLLEHEIGIPLPDSAMRREQLTVLTRGMPLADDVRLDDVAGRTPGFVAADLAALAREAGVRAALRQKSAADSPQVTMTDFDKALEVVRPTSMQESSLELAKLTLDDVGDMAEVKETLTESVLWPLSYPDAFSRLGVQPPRGVLLYGPPGCGKTYLVKAIAGTGKANVLSVKGAELLSKWVGESERAVRELFRRAREAAPTLVFLDEVDALAPIRGQASDGGTTDRVVAALLTELDGVESLRNVVVIGATNRPDLVDPALLRPGRLERLVFVPPPDAEARADILRATAKDVPLAPDVDLPKLAADLDRFSAADCAALIREAALAAMRESLEASTVTAAHVATARERVRPSLDPLQVAWLSAYAEAQSTR